MTLQNCLSQTMYICTADESLKKSLQNTTYFHIRLLQWHIGPPFRNQEGVGDSIDDSASSFSPISGRPLRLCGLLWSLWSSFPLLTFVKTAEGYATERFRGFSILTLSVIGNCFPDGLLTLFDNKGSLGSLQCLFVFDAKGTEENSYW